MLRYLVLTNVFKKEIPWVIEFSVTWSCQCKCVHCSVGKYEVDKTNELTNEQIKKVLDQIIEMGTFKVDFFGGEPLLRKDIIDLVTYGSKKGLYISITTNAWLLTKDLTRKLKKAGISCINISLDSITEEKHDGLRGLKGIYRKAIDGVKYCYEEGVACIVSTYVTRNRIKNIGLGDADDSQLKKMISFAKELKASAIRILFPIISGKWEENKEKMFTDEEKRKVIDYIDPSFAFIEGAFSVKNKKKVCQSLSGKMFHITPNGDLQICVAFPDTFGNVKDNSLYDLLKGMWSHPTYLKNKNGDCCSTADLKR
jgi:MoaA/NifB/PqqE/SkfB family radical SAM enzyme